MLETVASLVYRTLQLIEIIDSLREAGMLNSLKMLHFHLGSQVPNIRNGPRRHYRSLSILCQPHQRGRTDGLF